MNWPYHSLAAAVGAAHDLAVRSEPAVKSLLLALLSCATHTQQSCAEAVHLVSDALKAAGMSVDTYFPTGAAGVQFPVLIGWVGARRAMPDVLLCTHLDTSPAGDGWSRNPLGEEHGGFIFGRGAVVSKSDVAVFIHATKAAWGALKAKPDTSIAVAITCDEGTGGDYGAAYLLKHLGLQPRMAVLAGVSDAITIAHNGCVQIKVKLVGTACHQSLVPPREDAMRHATTICARLYARADQLSLQRSSIPGVSFPTLNITKIAGGASFGMSPRDVEVWVDRRVLPDEDLRFARDDLVDSITALQADTDVNTEIEVVRMAEPMRPSELQVEFVRLLQAEAYQAFGKMLMTQGATLYTDARWFSNAGIPTVMFGAGEADIRVSGANGSDERVPERCLSEATIILARALVSFCAGPRTRGSS